MNITKSVFVDLRKNTDKIIDVFKKWDRGSRTIEFTILEDGNQVLLDGSIHKVVISMKKPDGQCIYNDCEIVGGAAVVKFTEQMLAAAGMANAELNIYDIPSKTLAATSTLKFRINDKVVDDIEIQSSHEYNALTNMIFANAEAVKECREATETANEKIDGMTRLNDSVETAELSRVQNELERCEAEENRVSAETRRDNEEAVRSTAEEGRKSAESSRAANESERETAESQRQEQEADRISAENARCSSETQRESNEADRLQKEQERTESESARLQAETARVEAELARASSESARNLAEDSRIQAETEREAMAVSMGTATQAANEAADRANTAADRADGVAEGGISNMVVNFEEAATRENIQGGSTLGNLFGKIKKWFSSLGSAALCNAANSLDITEEGSVLDARQGKILDEKIGVMNNLPTDNKTSLVGAVNELNGDIGTISNSLAGVKAVTSGLSGLYFTQKNTGNGSNEIYVTITPGNVDKKSGVLIFGSLNNYPFVASVQFVESPKGNGSTTGGFCTYYNGTEVKNVKVYSSMSNNILTIGLPGEGKYGVYYLLSGTKIS